MLCAAAACRRWLIRFRAPREPGSVNSAASLWKIRRVSPLWLPDCHYQTRHVGDLVLTSPPNRTEHLPTSYLPFLILPKLLEFHPQTVRKAQWWVQWSHRARKIALARDKQPPSKSSVGPGPVPSRCPSNIKRRGDSKTAAQRLHTSHTAPTCKHAARRTQHGRNKPGRLQSRRA